MNIGTLIPVVLSKKLAFMCFTAESKSDCVMTVTNCGIYLFLIPDLAFSVCFHIVDCLETCQIVF